MSKKQIEFEIEYSITEIDTGNLIIDHATIDMLADNREHAIMSLMVATSMALNLKGTQLNIHSTLELPEA